MPNQPTLNQHMTSHDGYEHEDLTSRGPFYFMAGLALLGLVIYLIVFGMYRFLDRYDLAHQPPLSPMATPEADTRAVTHEETQTFPQPRLEENERTRASLSSSKIRTGSSPPTTGWIRTKALCGFRSTAPWS